MRFEREIEEESVPEWKAKYLNYKLGKQKIKACVRAIEKANRTPRTFPTPRSRRLRRSSIPPQAHPEPSTTSQPVQNGGEHGQPTETNADPAAATYHLETTGWESPEAIRTVDSVPRKPKHDTKVATSTETQPLKNAHDADQGGSYGSLESTPRFGSTMKMRTSGNDNVGNGKGKLEDRKLGSPETRKSGSWLWKPKSKSVSMGPPLLKLPEPALASSHNELDFSSGEVISSRAIDHTDAAAGPSQERRDSPEMNQAPPPRRSLTTPFTPSRRPTLLNRILSTYSYRGPPASVLGVPLEVYREFDACQADFFHFLDEELDKVETFYKQKEDDAYERLKVLREQLQLMKSKQAEESRRKRIAKAIRPTANGRTSSNIAPAAGDGWAHNITHSLGLDLSRRSKGAKNDPRGASSQSKGMDSSKQGESSAINEVSYSQAKSSLKHALQDFYKNLEMLKSYAMMNRTAFRKINKKYDKAINSRRGRYMSEKVDQSWFVQSDVLDNYLVDVENLYARYFEKGSHKIAVKRLRTRRQTDYSASTFRTGLLLGAGTVLAVRALMYASDTMAVASSTTILQTTYLLQIYAGYFLALLLVLLFCLNCKIWVNQKISYVFIFEFDTRHNLDWRQLAEIPSLLWLLLGLTMWLNFKEGGWNPMFLYWPIVLVVLSVLILFSPVKLLYHRSRLWWAVSNLRLYAAGLHPVEFRDFLLGDMYCSLAYTMGNIELFFCFYTICWGGKSQCNDPSMCGSSNSRLLGFLTCLPGIWRFLQCWRRYRDSRMFFPHVVNSGKYFCTVMYYMFLSLYRIQKASDNDPDSGAEVLSRETVILKGLFIFFAVANSIYVSIWDLFIDWSLGDVHCKWPLLREPLGFAWTPVYYVAMVIDPILRFNWILYVIVSNELQQSAFLSFIISLSEIFRRAFWATIRVENEHMTNVGMFRASKDLPLPFSLATTVSPPFNTEEEAEARGPAIEAQISRTPRSPRAMRTPTRVGAAMANAHAHDFERRRPDESSSDEDDEELERERREADHE